MPDDKEIQDRLATYSMRSAANATQIALAEQRLAAQEKLIEGYHQRLHMAEDKIITIKVIQEIHDTEIKGIKKILVGNGTRDTIPMDLQRLEQNIQNILKVDWQEMKRATEELNEWKDQLEARAWQLGLILAGLIISQIWQWFTP